MNDHCRVGCGRIEPMLAAYARGELPDGRGFDVERHLASCPACRAQVAFERRLAERLRELRHMKVPPRLERRVREIMSAERPGA